MGATLTKLERPSKMQANKHKGELLSLMPGGDSLLSLA